MNDWNRLPYDLRAVSVHEAGHAVVAVLLGHRVKRLWLCDRTFSGRVTYRHQTPAGWSRAVRAAAGHAAERLVFGYVRNPASDFVNVCRGLRAVDRAAVGVLEEQVADLEERLGDVLDKMEVRGLILRVAKTLAQRGEMTEADLTRVGGLALQDTLLRHCFREACQRLVNRFLDEWIVPRIAAELVRGWSRSELAREIAQ